MLRPAAGILLAILGLAARPAATEAQTADSTTPAPLAGKALPATELARLVTPPAGAPDHERRAPTVAAVAADGAIDLDGRLDEPVWRTAPVVDRFLQREPHEGRPGTQRTEVRFAYDDRNLYVGARMFDDRGPAGVTSRLVRRDSETESDWLILTFDTFLDHRGQTVFALSPAGARRDSYGPAGAEPDPSWNPVWRAETEVDSVGWTAEIAIPFSQLRFRSGQDQTWGLQVEREVSRLNEIQVWSLWLQDEEGGPPRFGHLSGISAPQAGLGRLEVLPYVAAQMETKAEVDADDPFTEDRDGSFRAGADVKYLVTSDLTLNATVNPDFGQAEVDPAVVNLSDIETFFDEKREFFIEGSGLFQFGELWCYSCSNISSLDMLFTRRIGRAPQAGFLAEDRGDFADVPDAATIWTAAKLTGRTRGGTSIGVLGGLTDREHAEILVPGGVFRDQEVEPATSYAVARVKQDLRDGNLQVGGILTSVARSFDDPALEDLLASHAEGLGLDADWWWGDRTYRFMASGAVTSVSGSEAAITRVQRSSVHYLQRPDRQSGRFDPNAESLRGWALYSRVGKQAGPWRWEGQVSTRSPGFENNDLGFLTRTDYVWMNGNLRRQWTTPNRWYRWLSLSGGAQQEYNFDGDVRARQFHGSVYTITPFYWEASLFGFHRPATWDDRLTRGGPVVRAPSSWYTEAFLLTDTRKPVVFEFVPWWFGNEEGVHDVRLGLTATWKPATNVSVTLGPIYENSESSAQFVTTVEDATAEAFFGTRTVFADLDQETLSMDTRVDWTFSPTMSLELFVQPLVSSSDFSRFKEFARPRTQQKLVYGEDVGTIREEAVGETRAFFVDPDGPGPAAEFSFEDPDFNFRSLRGNLVFRWEYLPGSTLFLVWTQDRNSTLARGDFDLGRDVDALLDADPDNIFLVKLTYWLGI
jgi:hypothetical protein